MHQQTANTYCLELACKKVGVPYVFHDSNRNFMTLTVGDKQFQFVKGATPFNTTSQVSIMNDKEFTYSLLHNSLAMPLTKGYFTPTPLRSSYHKYVQYVSVEAITDDILMNFSLPVVVKMNSGERATNVYLCKTRQEIRGALKFIYDQHSAHFDYIALAQEYVFVKKEYRAIIFQGKVLLAYEKVPVFWNEDKKQEYRTMSDRDIPDRALVEKLEKFIVPAYKKFSFEYTGADIIEDKNGKLWLLELNSCPQFGAFVDRHGEELLIKMYEYLLEYLEQL